MLITAICPRCETSFRVDEGLRGKRMRCPNATCRTVFEVGAEAANPPAEPTPVTPEPPKPPASGSVTEMVPVLSAEIAEPAPPAVQPPAPPKPKPQKEVRPPRKVEPLVSRPIEPPRIEPPPIEPPTDFPDDFPGDETIEEPSPAAEGPREIGPGTWEAPPVRGVGVEPIVATGAPSLDGAPQDTPIPTAPATPPVHARWRPLAVIAAMAVLLAGTLGVGWWVVEGTRTGNEAERFKRAQEMYDQGEYADANLALQKLIADFPSSADGRKYRFLAELSSVRSEADSARELAELKPALEHVLQFVSFNQNETLLKDRHPDVWQMLRRLAERLTAEAETQHDSSALELARRAWSEADKKFQPPANVSGAEVGQKLTREFERVAQVLAVYRQREQVIAEIRGHISQASAAGVQRARALAASAGLKDDAEVKVLLAGLVAAHRGAVKYEPAAADAGDDIVAEDTLPGVLIMPALTKAKVAKGGKTGLALARGVLYALDVDNGTLRWAKRVGIDTTLLPLRIPADPITPELVLVVSSDSQSVSAVVADTGTVVWQRGLGSPCTGQPVLVGHSLLVPTLSGRVDEIEISAGRLLGHYQLGQRLTVGGVRQPGTSLVYFPGDAFCVYALDVATRTCAGVLYSNHPAGSLRGVPIVVRGQKASTTEGAVKGPTGWLLLCQANGSDSFEVRPFELPIGDADQASRGPIVHIPGSVSSPPYHDAEKLAIATDAGLLSLWGIRLKGNRDDPLLFSILGSHYEIAGGKGPGRAQVVHADGEGYWVLAGGGLHRLESVFRPDSGPGLRAVWAKAAPLGTPLHAVQPVREADGRSLLLATTLAVDRPVCLCTAVDAASGDFRWQRQVGGVVRHPPLTAHAKVLLRDAGGILMLDPSQVPEPAGTSWHVADEFVVREPLGPDDAVALLTAADGFVELSGSKLKLRVRQVPLKGETTSKAFDLPAALAGTPALGDGFLLLPLADGVAYRLDLRGELGLVTGPNWRAKGADDNTQGHIVPLVGDDFLVTDGSRGIDVVNWSGPKAHERRARAALSHRITAPPAVLPAPAGAAPRVCVADASDVVTLLESERLTVVRRWTMPGRITSGPVVRGTGIVCVVDGKRVVRIAPDRDGPWEYTMVSSVVGAPNVVEGMLVAADVSGRFLALDLQTGSPLGPGYTLRANVAPDAAPVPFGPGRLLVPLNDGTLVLLPLDKLR